MKRALLSLFLAFPVVAQTTPAPVVIRAARMFVGNADSIVTPGVVVVSGNRITAAGPAAAIPTGATVIDLGDATLLPGFIDSHTHLSVFRDGIELRR
jgi:imidazolonepropionase-like amidohydrolase